MINLRPIQPSDRDFLLRVYAGTREAELRQTPWTDEQKDAFVRQQFDAQDTYYRQHYEDATFDVVEVDGEAAGRLYVWRGGEEIRVIDIAILAAYQNRGIGTRLLREVLEEAASTGRSVSIHVEKFNPAQSLYRRLGFQQTADGDVYIRMDWRPKP